MMSVGGSYAWRRAALVLLGLLLAVLAAALPVMRDVELKLGDALASLTAPVGRFDGIVVVDVDEESMQRLQSQLGAWPYDRHVYALVNRYLLGSGAAIVAYDILFSEARAGDAEFAATMTEKNVLATAALPGTGLTRDAAWRSRLAQHAWLHDAAHDAAWPAQRWNDLTLPLPAFTARASIGVISVLPDEDGVLRRVPILHRAHGEVVPGMAAQVLKIAGDLQLDAAAQRIRVAGALLPLDSQGRLLLRYPRDFGGLRVLPFYQVALAASGAPEYAGLAQTLRGSTVVLGSSSAVLGDFVQTPRGRAAGLFLVAALPALLKHGMVLHPRDWLLDGWLMLMLAACALAAAHPRLQRRVWMQALTLPLLLLLAAALVAGLAAAGRSAALLPAALAGAFIHLGLLVWRQMDMLRESRRLLVDKLAAEESVRLKSHFLSHMTHELRTPLTAILGFNNINWQSSDLGRDQRIRNSEVIDRNGRHLMALINGILEQAKLEAGQVRISAQPEHLRAVVDDVVATLQPLVRDKPVTLAAHYGEGVPGTLEMDAFRVRQILLNLTGNAIKFTERGSVMLNVAWLAGRLSVEIADTGPGLSKAALARLFVAFQQADDKVAATHGGTGLGLTISRELATLMQGDITVESEPGVGTKFTLRIPAAVATPADPAQDVAREAGETVASAAAPAATAADESAAGAPAGATAGATTAAPPAAPPLYGKVLLAEDTDDLRALAVLHLKRLGLTVIEAVNGQEAVDRGLGDNPDVILMDLEMPVLHGLEAIRTLRARGFSGPILAMTAHTGAEERAQALAAGCNDMLSKPVSRANLRAALDGALSVRLPPV